MGVTHARLKTVAKDHMELSAVVCSGDVCATRLITLALEGDPQRWLALLSLSPPLTILWQPLALLIIVAMAAFAGLLFCPTPQGDTVLLVLGGRESAWLVAYAAVLAHVVEAAVAARALARLREECDARSAALWLGGTLLLGMPVLRYVKMLDERRPS